MFSTAAGVRAVKAGSVQNRDGTYFAKFFVLDMSSAGAFVSSMGLTQCVQLNLAPFCATHAVLRTRKSTSPTCVESFAHGCCLRIVHGTGSCCLFVTGASLVRVLRCNLRFSSPLSYL